MDEDATTTSMEVDDGSTSEMESKAIAALQQRLEALKMNLEMAHDECETKKNFIQETVGKIQTLAQTGAVAPFVCPSTLVHVFPSSTASKNDADVRLPQSPVVVLQILKKLYMQNWMIILQVMNRSTETLGDLTLELTSDDVMDYEVKNYSVSDQQWRTSSGGENLLTPQETKLLVAVIPFSQKLFVKLDVAIHVAVGYRIQTARHSTIRNTDSTSITSNHDWSSLYQTSFGHLILKYSEQTGNFAFVESSALSWALQPDEVNKVLHFTDFALENLILTATMLSIIVTVKSVDTNLSNLRNKLVCCFPLKPIFNILIWDDAHSLLSGLRLVMPGESTTNECHLEIQYNNEPQVILFLQIFYKTFPEDILITPNRNICNRKKFLNCLQRELDILKRLQTYSATETIQLNPQTSASCSLNDVREHFNCSQKNFQSKFDNTMNMTDYHNFRKDLTKYELETDLSVGLLQHPLSN